MKVKALIRAMGIEVRRLRPDFAYSPLGLYRPVLWVEGGRLRMRWGPA